MKKLKGSQKFKTAGGYFDLFILILIFLNVLSVVYETVDELYKTYKLWFDGFELFSILVFTIEYVFRLVVCVNDKRYKHPINGRFKYAMTPLAIVDLFSFLPFYIPFLIPLDLRFIRVIRLLRFFRILKVGHYSKTLHLIVKVIHSRRRELTITFLLAGIMLFITSCFMYFAEHDVQPTAFPDIPSTIWWCVMAISNIGYHETYPITAMGKSIGAIIAFVEIGLFALPAGILGSGFVEAIREHDKALNKKNRFYKED